jgi:carboxymethylenebutenolidase
MAVELDVEIRTRDGLMPTYVARPDGDGPFPVIVMMIDGGSHAFNDHSVALRLAEHGYYAIIGNLFYHPVSIVSDETVTRLAERLDATGLAGHDGVAADAAARLLGVVEVLMEDDDALMLSDIAALLEYVRTDPCASDGPKGAMGFCMGARFAMRMLVAAPDEFTAAAGLHPFGVMTEGEDENPLRLGQSSESLHRSLPGISGEFYLGYAEIDPVTPAASIGPVAKVVDDHQLRGTIDVHKGAVHGFMFPTTDEYHRVAAEDSWEKCLRMFNRSVRDRQPG